MAPQSLVEENAQLRAENERLKALLAQKEQNNRPSASGLTQQAADHTTTQVNITQQPEASTGFSKVPRERWEKLFGCVGSACLALLWIPGDPGVPVL